MTNDDTCLDTKALLEREAIAWFTRMSGNPSRQESRDFQRWLASCDENTRAYEATRKLWFQLGAVAEIMGKDASADLARPLEIIRKRKLRHRGRAIVSVAGGCLALLMGAGWLWLEEPHFWQDLNANIVTSRGERRVVTLVDGSKVELDADTAMEVDVSSTRRRVRLLRGNAYFGVKPEEIPFVVEAVDGETRVMGTEFDISIQRNGSVTTTLAKGVVSVHLPGTSEEIILEPGQSVSYDTSGIGEARTVDTEEITAWRNGRFIFANARLEDVLAHIERYRDGRIVLTSSALANRTVSGNIALDDPDRALAAMQSSVGFRMTKITGKLVVISP
ncbi:FecR family protein (plasmid) [Rhizobium sp. NIBRBAC000502774]|nr:FecR family protein [Rhizobium sp. NIBRBAC000502774]